MGRTEQAIWEEWEAARDRALGLGDLDVHGHECLHPDCGSVCIPPAPVFCTAWCETCRAETRQVSEHDWFGVHVLDRCLACETLQ